MTAPLLRLQRTALGLLATLAMVGPLRAQPEAPPSSSDQAWWGRLGRVAAALPDATDLATVLCIEADPRLRWSTAGAMVDDERQAEALRLRMESCAVSTLAASDPQPPTRLVKQLRASLQDRAKRLERLREAISHCRRSPVPQGTGLDALFECLQSWTGTTLSADQRRAVELLTTSPTAVSTPMSSVDGDRTTSAGSSSP